MSTLNVPNWERETTLPDSLAASACATVEASLSTVMSKSATGFAHEQVANGASHQIDGDAVLHAYLHRFA